MNQTPTTYVYMPANANIPYTTGPGGTAPPLPSNPRPSGPPYLLQQAPVKDEKPPRLLEEIRLETFFDALGLTDMILGKKKKKKPRPAEPKNPQLVVPPPPPVIQHSPYRPVYIGGRPPVPHGYPVYVGLGSGPGLPPPPAPPAPPPAPPQPPPPPAPYIVAPMGNLYTAAVASAEGQYRESMSTQRPETWRQDRREHRRKISNGNRPSSSDKAARKSKRGSSHGTEYRIERTVYHTCVICGRLRSRRYQRRHPIVAGAPIPAGVCRRCRHSRKDKDNGHGHKPTVRAANRSSHGMYRMLDHEEFVDKRNDMENYNGAKTSCRHAKARSRGFPKYRRQLVSMIRGEQRSTSSTSQRKGGNLRQREDFVRHPQERGHYENFYEKMKERRVTSIQNVPFSKHVRNGVSPAFRAIVRQPRGQPKVESEPLLPKKPRGAQNPIRKSAEERIASHPRAYNHMPVCRPGKHYHLPSLPQLPIKEGYAYRTPARHRTRNWAESPNETEIGDHPSSDNSRRTLSPDRMATSVSSDHSISRLPSSQSFSDDTRYRTPTLSDDTPEQKATFDSLAVDVGRQTVHFGPSSPFSGRDKRFHRSTDSHSTARMNRTAMKTGGNGGFPIREDSTVVVEYYSDEPEWSSATASADDSWFERRAMLNSVPPRSDRFSIRDV